MHKHLKILVTLSILLFGVMHLHAQNRHKKTRYDFYNKYQIPNRLGFMSGLGYSPKNGHFFLNFDGTFHNRNSFGLKLNVGLPFATGISGSVNNQVGWYEKPEEVTGTGSYYYTTDIGFGFMENVYAFVIAGAAYKVNFKNAMSRELENTGAGKYYKTHFEKITYNLGVEFGGYVLDNFLLGVHLSLIQGAGAKVGYMF